MKLLLMTVLLILVLGSSTLASETKKNWKLTKGIKNPESVYVDTDSNAIFVSNIDGAGDSKDGNGYISKITSSGEMVKEKWATGFNAPKGMRSYKKYLWVSDIDQVYKVDIKTGKKVQQFRIRGAKFLNDIAISKTGTIFISDTITSKIHIIKDDIETTFIEGENLESPNGLLVRGGKLHVASWGLTKDWSTKVLGRIYTINIDTKKITYITKSPLGNLDGLEFSKNGYLVSDWVAGKIYSVSSDGSKVKMIFRGKKGLADIGYLPKTKTILIPYMLDNIVTKHQL